ncbi:Hypothetical protein CINCED_3A013339 [Cinara cedri]|uniref:Uncharacterized protein n=1 Tax=Cinara cedri TaxID=506608 RepID=A0A5E4M5L5_9HEMI|nr:Hypothetical protein CINCED_3A013339 [Cinara cedri]
MFWQIQVHTKDQQFQGIVWRDDPSKVVQSYKLTTVTYGLITSPYHALRVLKQLALFEQDSYPIGVKILLNDFYVDEVMTGSDNLRQCSQTQIIYRPYIFSKKVRGPNSKCPLFYLYTKN